MTLEIKVLDPVHCRANKEDIRLLKPCLSYEASYWRQGQYGKERKVYRKSLISKTGLFLTGFQQRVQDYCNRQSISIKWAGYDEKVMVHLSPSLDEVTFREDQTEAITKATLKQRGVIKAPTGSGKTIVALGIMSCLPADCRILFLCHTLDLIDQTYDELKRFGFCGIGRIDSMHKEIGRITVATVQSFSKMDLWDQSDRFDVVMVDECHHLSSFSNTYAKILSSLLAPVRLGFTGTMPDREESKLALEGLIGPLVGELTIQQAAELSILAVPKVKLFRVPYNASVKQLRRYEDVYQVGVVENKGRNRLILRVVKELVGEGKSVLIIVLRIEHGEILLQMAETLFDLDIVFVQGETEAEVRRQTRLAMIDKKVKCVVATAVWREGINIPSLDAVVNAAGGKSEIATLQAIGRGLRKTDDKSEVLIVDFFDNSHHYLISHFGERVCLYIDQGWL